MLNALLGLGTALAPVFVAIFVGLGSGGACRCWWPFCWSGLLAVQPAACRCRQATIEAAEPGTAGQRRAARALLGLRRLRAALRHRRNHERKLGIDLYDDNDLAASTGHGIAGVDRILGMVTVGRVLFAAIERRFPEQRTYHLLPFVAAAALLATALLPTGSPGLGVLAFGLAGLGCSALLPLTISFGQDELTTMAAAVAGGLIAFYQIGYGIAAFGVAPLEQLTGRGLSAVFAMAAAVALMMGLLSFVVARRDKAGAAAQPQRT